MEEIKEKIVNIEYLLASAINNMNEIVKNANDPQKRAKEAQILIEASERINSVSNEINGLISKEKALIDGFKPVVEVRQNKYMVNVNKPLAWIGGAICAILISFCTCYMFYSNLQEEKALTEKYKNESGVKDWNHMKYKYLLLFGEQSIVKELKDFDKDYNKNWKIYDKKVIKREKELNEAERTRKEAELRAAEAKELQQHADSLQNIQ